MNASVSRKGEGRCFRALFFIPVYFSLTAAAALAGDLMSTICKNEVVSVGDRKGEILVKCGPPLSKTQETVGTHTEQVLRKKKTVKKQPAKDTIVTGKSKTVKERGETWTYVIDGSYRFFIFKEGKLATIETGGLAN